MTHSSDSSAPSRPSNDLVKLAKSSEPGASDARWQLVKHYEPLMHKVFMRLHLDWVPEAEDGKADERRQKATNPEWSEDARQAAWLGVLEALDRFDPERGFPFTAFVGRRVKGAIVDATRPEWQYYDYAEPLSHFEAMPDDTQKQEVQKAVQDFLDSLPPRQRSVVELVGLGGMKPADAARELGISREAVSQLWRKARSKGLVMLCDYAPNI